MDCSGHGTIVGRHLGTRKTFDDPNLQKVAYFEHFDHVERPPGEATGHPCIVMCEEGWFWLIGLNETRTSVGFVTRPEFVKTLGVPADRLLAWAVARCPAVRHRMRDAVGPDTNRVLSDFSYRCRPYAGPGYFLVGDAGCFLDPIFSTGATLAMMGAQAAAGGAIAMLRGQITPQRARARYLKFVDHSTGIFWRMIRGYYHHSFRELFMQGAGPLQVHKAIISILAGQVFPRPAWALRWRMWMFHCMVRAQKIVPLVPRREPFSLLAGSDSPTQQPLAMARA
jgi:2-polyprenyl-6-methoxyphenol hydroxylase-like FAD-dependent oxidoreductase